jgi:Ca-activated chloride channel family protein
MWTPRQLTSSVAILLLLTVAGADSQRSDRSAEGPLETLRVNVNLVTIGVRVSDQRNREVSGLKQEEFSIFEDGRQQQIAVFASEQQPVSVLILLDRSYSMGQSGKLDQAKSALTQLLANSHPDNEYALVVFDNESIPLLHFSADRQRIGSLLGRIGSDRAGSSLYDSMVLALDRFDPARYPRHVLVVITDGADQHSRLRLDDVLSAVQASRAQVYLVGFLDPKEDAVFRESGKTVTLISGQEIDNPRYVFKHLAAESGAERYFPGSGEELATAMRTIAQDLRAQYTLGYYTSRSDRGMQYRRIEVKVRPRGLRVRARHGFLSLGDDETELPVSAVPVRPSGAETIQERTLPYEIKTEHRDGQVIFREDFSDPATGWPQKPGFFLKEGRYHLEQLRPKAFNEGRVAANGPWWTDLEASVVVEFESAQDFRSGPPAAGLVFRLNERGYYALVISHPVGFAKVYYKLVEKFHAAAAHDLLFWDQEWRTGPSRPFQHTLGVVCRGNLIQLYVDGLRVRELRDESFSDGIVGTVLFGEGHAVFDDLLAQSIY